MTAPARPAPWLALRELPPPLVRRAAGVVTVLLVLVVWALLTRGATAESRAISPTVLPSPFEVLRSFPVLLTERNLVGSIAASMQRVLLGFGLAAIIAVPLGIAAGSYRLVDAASQPISVFMRNVPVAALIPLTLQAFGVGELQKVMFLFLATAPFLFHEVARAVALVDDRYVDTAQTLGARPRQIVSKVLIALAAPSIYGALRANFGMAFGYVMLAEVVDARAGLGFLLLQSQRRGLPEHLLATLLVIGLLAWLIDQTFRFFGRGFFPYLKAGE
ncbi:MAG: ABC transporter permease subunit [Cytophagaceae bacterium]|nr:ABC transporter permease subunit [Gemmatimonadaceae bacterium]